MRKFIQELYAKFDGICQSCGIKTSFSDFEYLDEDKPTNLRRRLGPTYPTREHVIPKAVLKGKYVENNVILYCHSCNNNGSREVARMLYSGT